MQLGWGLSLAGLTRHAKRRESADGLRSRSHEREPIHGAAGRAGQRAPSRPSGSHSLSRGGSLGPMAAHSRNS